MSHITGGGLANNLARVIPNDMAAVLRRSSWTPPAIFQIVQTVGGAQAGRRRRHPQHGRGHGGDPASARGRRGPGGARRTRCPRVGAGRDPGLRGAWRGVPPLAGGAPPSSARRGLARVPAMGTIAETLASVIPIVLLIALGILLRRLRVLDDARGRGPEAPHRQRCAPCGAVHRIPVDGVPGRIPGAHRDHPRRLRPAARHGCRGAARVWARRPWPPSCSPGSSSAWWGWRCTRRPTDSATCRRRRSSGWGTSSSSGSSS